MRGPRHFFNRLMLPIVRDPVEFRTDFISFSSGKFGDLLSSAPRSSDKLGGPVGARPAAPLTPGFVLRRVHELVRGSFDRSRR
jgi:hypothetical protein